MKYGYISWDTVNLITGLFLESIPNRKIELSVRSMDLNVDFDSVSVNEDWYIGNIQKFKYYFMDYENTDVLKIKDKYYTFFLHLAYNSGEISKIFLGTEPIVFGSDYFCQIKITDCVEDDNYIYLVKKLNKLAGDGAIARLNKGAENIEEKIQRRQRLVEITESDTLSFNDDEWIIISKISKRKLENKDNWNDIFTYLINDIIKYCIYVEYVLVEKDIQEKTN